MACLVWKSRVHGSISFSSWTHFLQNHLFHPVVETSSTISVFPALLVEVKKGKPLVEEVARSSPDVTRAEVAL